MQPFSCLPNFLHFLVSYGQPPIEVSGNFVKVNKTMIPVIDTHQHLWDLSRFRLPWLKKVPKLSRSYLPQDYQEEPRSLVGSLDRVRS